MLETVKFPMGPCPRCGPNVLLAAELDEHDRLIRVCSHCGHPMPSGFVPKEVGARSLELYGYTVEGETESKGCGGGTGGCGGSCSV